MHISARIKKCLDDNKDIELENLVIKPEKNLMNGYALIYEETKSEDLLDVHRKQLTAIVDLVNDDYILLSPKSSLDKSKTQTIYIDKSEKIIPDKELYLYLGSYIYRKELMEEIEKHKDKYLNKTLVSELYRDKENLYKYYLDKDNLLEDVFGELPSYRPDKITLDYILAIYNGNTIEPIKQRAIDYLTIKESGTIQCLAYLENIKRIEEEIEQDPLKDRKKYIIKYLKSLSESNKYQKYIIAYQDNESSPIKKESVYSIDKIDLLKDNRIHTIPLYKIRWIEEDKTHNVIYDSTNFEKAELTKVQEAIEQMKVGLSTSLYHEYKDNKEFIKQLILLDDTVIPVIDKDMLEDKELLLSIIKKDPNIDIYERDLDFFKSPKNCRDIINVYKEKDITMSDDNYINFIHKIPNIFFAKISNVNLLYDITPSIRLPLFVNKISKETLNSDKFIEHISDKGLSDEALLKATNPKLLYKLIECNESNTWRLFKYNLGKISETLMTEEIIDDFLNMYRALDYNTVIKILPYFTENFYIINRLVDSLTCQRMAIDKDYKEKIEKFLDIAKIDKDDTEKMYQLASKNIYFLLVMSKEKRKDYIIGELYGINKISKESKIDSMFCKSNTLELNTEYGTFETDKFGKIITYREKHGNTIDLFLTGISNEKAEEIAMESISEIYPEYTGMKWKDFFYEYTGKDDKEPEL